MIKSFLKRRDENKKKCHQAFLNLQKSVEKIISKKFDVALDHGEIWFELDNIKQDFLYSDLKFFNFVENIEKLLIEFVRLQKKIHSEILHKRSADSLILKEKEILGFLQKLIFIDFVKIDRVFKNDLKGLIKRIDSEFLTIK